MTNRISSEGVNAHDDFLLLFRKGLKFTEELLAENEKLRFRVAALQSQGATTVDTVERSQVLELQSKVVALEAERQRLVQSQLEAQQLSREYQTRYAEIENDHNNLANLYIASYQLHSTMTFKEVVQVVQEIVINLIGVSHFTLFLLDAKTQTLVPIVSEGHDCSKDAAVVIGVGDVGKAVAQRRRIVVAGTRRAPDGPLALIPLYTAEEIVGAIAIDELLVQKEALTAIDNELFNVLSVHGATAMLAGLLRDHVGNQAGARALSVDHARKLLAG